MFQRRQEIAPRLRQFEEEGDLVVCKEVDDDVKEIADICERIHASGLLPERAGIGLDSYGIATLLDVLAERGLEGDLTLAVGQGWKLQSAITTLPRKLKDRTMVHCGQPIMAWAAGNAKTELRGSNYLVTKQAAGASKIDPLMALFNAAMLMFLNPEASGRSVYETRGIRMI
ncbi:hypothetical protein [Rhizobium deserti]|uniref:hypothetical protein n=1 Tax=Rhizobium deserti TaxID=2547961 RepID=UPI00192A5BEE|nr:hypothetical protein [Rhizobium deserti]